MKKRELIFVILAFAFAIVSGGLAIALTKDKKAEPSTTAPTAQHHEATEESATPENIVDLTDQTEVSLDIKDFAYSKRDIRIKTGTKVTWTNRDDVQHNAMLDHTGSGGTHDAPKADEVKADVFAGPLLAKGESYSFTFNKAGLNPYHCAPHPTMKGSVTVVN